MGLGLGNQAGSPPLQGAVNQAIAEGGIVTDVTSNRQFDSEDITVVGQMLTGGNSGQSGGGEWSGAVRLAALRYDYRNQMVEYENLDFGGVTLYAYDCFGRRISKTLDANGSPTRTRCVNGGHMNWQVLQERSGTGSGPNAGAILADYVYGNYVDEPLMMRRAAGDYYFFADDLFNVTCLTDATGAVVERYRYGDYGLPTIFTASGSTLYESAFGNTRLWNGREFDRETSFYHYRTRYLEPSWGRFTTRDTIGVWGDGANVGNGIAYVGSIPWTGVDPTGRQVLVAAMHGQSFFGLARASIDIVDSLMLRLKAMPVTSKLFGEDADRWGTARYWLRSELSLAKSTALANPNNCGCVPNSPVVLIGHSHGGDAARELTYKLERDGIKVHLLVLIDAVSREWQYGDEPEKQYHAAASVERVINFFQRDDPGSILGFKLQGYRIHARPQDIKVWWRMPQVAGQTTQQYQDMLNEPEKMHMEIARSNEVLDETVRQINFLPALDYSPCNKSP